MKRISCIIICSLFFLCACEKNDVGSVNEEPTVEPVVSTTELYCSEIPGTRVAETLVKESLSHEALIEIVSDQIYKLVGVYNCFERNDSLFYVVQPRDGEENNLNCITMLIGEPTRYLSIADNYTTEWNRYIGVEPEAYYRSYSYNAETQTFVDFVQAGYSVKNFKVQYVDKECLVLSADAVYDGEEEHNAAAQFSRIVYKAVDKSELPICDIIDLRN